MYQILRKGDVVLSLISFKNQSLSQLISLRGAYIYIGFPRLSHMSSGSYRARTMYICSSVNKECSQFNESSSFHNTPYLEVLAVSLVLLDASVSESVHSLILAS